MLDFAYGRVASLAEAIAAVGQPGAMAIAGGTELVNWMKEGIAAPSRLVDLNRLEGLDRIIADEHGLVIGALARMSDVADHPRVAEDYPAIATALLKSASAQLRNMASMGGNLMQRTRCAYFRAEVELACNRRRPGSGCAAQGGEDRAGAIFGASEACVATHPSDVAVALSALDARVVIEGSAGRRVVALNDFYRPSDAVEGHGTVLEAGELIVAIIVPASPLARRSRYLKLRERASYEFALVSVAVGLDLDGDVIRAARVALGGVAHKPWRLTGAEARLAGVAIADEAALGAALAADFASARPGRQNGFKVELVRRAVIRTLQAAGGIDDRN